MRDGDGNNMEDTSGYEKSSVRHASLGSEDLVLVLVPAESGAVPAILDIVNWLAY